MTLDALIEELQEAKEHFVPGKSHVKINIACTINGTTCYLENTSNIADVFYDDKCVTLEIEEKYD